MRCNFCEKSEAAVARLIASKPSGGPAYICDECVQACNWILAGSTKGLLRGTIQKVLYWMQAGLLRPQVLEP